MVSRLEDLVCLQCGHRQESQSAGPGLSITAGGEPANPYEDLKNHPELAGELEALGEIIDMLQNLGRARRKRVEELPAAFNPANGCLLIEAGSERERVLKYLPDELRKL